MRETLYDNDKPIVVADWENSSMNLLLSMIIKISVFYLLK